MSKHLRSCLLILVVLNLVFVQTTGAVSLQWMLPLFALTILAPLFSPLQRYRSYCLAWNLGLMAIFGLLLRDVSEVGVRYMLEDGLILAAFCQVHVLNNLAKQKHPDLVFFNSFLIALVTGFFCQDLTYSLVFAIYAVVLVIGICVAAASTVNSFPSRQLGPGELRPLIGRSLKMALISLGATALVFAFWPRDFDREGLVETQIAEVASGSQIGFADEIRLDNKGNVTKTNRIVIRAKLLKGSRDHVSEYWRGATFTNLQARGWWADTNPQPFGYTSTRQLDEPWQRDSANEFSRPGHRIGASLAVELSAARPQALFAPMQAIRLKFRCRAWPQLDGVFRISNARQEKIQYTLDLDRSDQPRRKPTPGFLRDLRRLHHGTVPAEISTLHDAVMRRAAANASGRQIATAIRRHLAENREYFLPGESGSVDNIRAFIAGEGGGHCEFFATTMVILLRKRGIPCRMVSGYHAHEWDDDENELIIRSNHAHAWVEMWDAELGWITLDPTPARRGRGDQEPSLLGEAASFFRGLWDRVTTFDAKDRSAVIAWVRTTLIDLGQAVMQHPSWFVGGLLALFGLRHCWRGRRRRRLEPAVADYLSTLRRLGLERRAGETPRQLLCRARTTELPQDKLEGLARATSTHERARYQ